MASFLQKARDAMQPSQIFKLPTTNSNNPATPNDNNSAIETTANIKVQEEISRLKSELEIMSDYKVQNEALKNQILLLSSATPIDQEHQIKQEQSITIRKLQEDLKHLQESLQLKDNELKSVKSQSKEIQDSLSKKIQELQRQVSVKVTPAQEAAFKSQFEEREKQIVSDFQVQIRALSEQINGQSANTDVIRAELDVALKAQDRYKALVHEREEQIKRLKSKNDELGILISEDKITIQAKEDEITRISGELSKSLRVSSEKSKENEQLQSLVAEKERRIVELEAKSNEGSGETDQLKEQLKSIEADYKALEKKFNILTKDYHKQISKAAPAASPTSTSGTGSGAAESNMAVKSLMSNSQAFLLENSKLKEKVQALEEERALSEEKMKKMTKELDTKSKMIIQYSLKDNLSKSSAASVAVNKQDSNKILSMLSNPKVMTEKMDPHVLTEINLQLQAVLGDLSARNFELEEEVNELKKMIRKLSTNK